MALAELLTQALSDLYGAAAEEAAWTHAGTTRTVRGSLIAPVTDPVYGNVTAPGQPIYECLVADVPGVARDDLLVIDGVSYHVLKAEPGRFGLMSLRLRT